MPFPKRSHFVLRRFRGGGSHHDWHPTDRLVYLLWPWHVQKNRKKFLARKPLTSRSKSKRASPQEESIDSIRGRKGENLAP